jgi:hypothetical protein
MIILGFGNRARQGKDVAGESIVEHYRPIPESCQNYMDWKWYKEPRIVLVKFAAALYAECRETYGMIDKDPVLLQNVGMHRREQDPNYWVDKAFASIPDKTDIAVFTDVRFHNEAWAIKERGGYLIEVVRLNQDGTRFYADDRPKDHPSELDLDDYNWDFHLQAKTGQAELIKRQAITLTEYIRSETK